MNKLLEPLYKGLNNLTNKHFSDTSKMLNYTMSIGWALSSIAQVGAIMINDKIPAKEKKFLIPQEIYDGVINVALFFSMTQIARNYAEKLVDKGKIATQLPIKNVKGFKNGFLTVVSLAGSVLASNIITPIVRNKFASYNQKNYTKKANAELYEFKAFGDRSPSTPRPYNMKNFLQIAKTRSLRV